MATPIHDPRSREGVELVFDGYRGYRADFRRLTLAARDYFERRDWAGAQRNAVTRLATYRLRLDETIGWLRSLFGYDLSTKVPWGELKALYGERLADLADAELAETFFNSATRRVFATVGIDPEIEFVGAATHAVEPCDPSPECELFRRIGTLEALLGSVLERHRFASGWADPAGDVELAAAAIRREIPDDEISGIELVRSPFFRGQAAYVAGRLRGPRQSSPIAFAFTHPEAGAQLDAVLLTEDEVSVLFSFTRSYFMVDAARPAELVHFLSSIMPRKPISELYNSIGHNKHGKTELYRALLHHLRTTDARFEIARGERGMVMVVFDLPGFDSVFKVIRDTFAYPKSTTRQEVMEKYRLVFQHDRAGRLVDAQEFEHLVFDRSRFSEELLAELAAKAPNTVEIAGERVHLGHLYTERRLTPLDVYLREAPLEAARAAVLDFGQSLRDLAATNIFPGDMLLKNFGVTRHKRVVFYDYDELTLATDCSFRELPEARSDEEETAGEAWYYVDEKDIFPEEFIHFFGIPAGLREVFLAEHGELLTAAFWRRAQDDTHAGVYRNVYPYTPDRRLRAG